MKVNIFLILSLNVQLFYYVIFFQHRGVVSDTSDT